jgi:hypothetical protein
MELVSMSYPLFLKELKRSRMSENNPKQKYIFKTYGYSITTDDEISESLNDMLYDGWKVLNHQMFKHNDGLDFVTFVFERIKGRK